MMVCDTSYHMMMRLIRWLGCVEDLGLYFATDEEAFGQVTTHELKYASI